MFEQIKVKVTFLRKVIEQRFVLLDRISRCSDVSKKRIYLQYLIIFSVSLAESLFVFFMVPFFEVFGRTDIRNKDEYSIPYKIIDQLFENLGFEVTLSLLGVCLVVAGLARELLSLTNQLSTQDLIGKIEKNSQIKMARVFLSSSFLSTQSIGSGNFYETVSTCSREISKLLHSNLQIFAAIVTLSSYLLLVMVSSPILAVGAIFIVGVGVLVLNYIARKAQKLGNTIVKDRKRLAQLTYSIYDQMRDIKINAIENISLEIFSSLASNLYSTYFRLVSVGSYARSILTGTILCLLITTIIWLKGNTLLDLSILAAALVMCLRTMPLALGLSRLRQGYFSKMAFLDNFERHLESLEQSKEDTFTGQSLGGFQSEIEFENVIFHYTQGCNPELSIDSLRVEKGQMVAVVGESGSGKTTLIDLIPRILNRSSGQVRIDGKKLDVLSARSVREKISYVPQDVKIYETTLSKNIFLEREQVSKAEVLKTLELVGLKKFAQNLPHGADTMLGQLGKKMSGGQRQRIGIARAIVKNSDILLLDEPTSALDPKNTQSVADLLLKLSREQGRTVIVVTHDWNLISNFDVMIRLASGKIVYNGPPQQQVLASSHVENSGVKNE